MTIENIRSKFNMIGSRWAFTGPVASRVHASYLRMKSHDAIQTIDIIIRKGNKDKFYDAFVSLGFEFRPEKSSRRVLYFSSKGKGLSATLTLSDDMPRHMSYDGRTPLVSLNALNKTRNVRRMLEFKNVALKLGNLNNVN